MSNEQRLTRSERELELALAGLRPAAIELSRDRLMFLAGRNSRGPSRYVWPAVAAMLAACLVLSLAISPPPRQVEHIVYVSAPAPAPTVETAATQPEASPTGGMSYLAARRILADGGDAAEALASGAGRDYRRGERTKPSSPVTLFFMELLTEN